MLRFHIGLLPAEPILTRLVNNFLRARRSPNCSDDTARPEAPRRAIYFRQARFLDI